MIAFKHVTLRRGPRKLLEDVDLRLQAGQRVGIVGANGTGKSSLLAMMLGELAPDAGEIEIPPGAEIATVRQHAPAGAQPAIEFVLDGDVELRAVESRLAKAEADNDGNAMAELHGRLAEIDGYAARARAARLLHGLGFAPSTHDAPHRRFLRRLAHAPESGRPRSCAAAICCCSTSPPTISTWMRCSGCRNISAPIRPR